jgi:hypothetical protein
MSVECHSPTYAAQQIAMLFDHLRGAALMLVPFAIFWAVLFHYDRKARLPPITAIKLRRSELSRCAH